MPLIIDILAWICDLQMIIMTYIHLTVISQLTFTDSATLVMRQGTVSASNLSTFSR